MKILFSLLLLTLTACSTTSPPLLPPVADRDATWQQRQTDLSAINHWLLNGRMAVLNDDEAWHLNMTWQRQSDNYLLDLSGPFGAGQARLSGSPAGVSLQDSDQNVFYADTPDQLLQQITGMRIPVQSLFYWIYGLPDKHSPVERVELDAYGRLAVLQQNGWQVTFKTYMQVRQHALPRKIVIQGFNLKVKIVIDNWDLQHSRITTAAG